MSRDLEAGADAALQAEHVDEIVFLEFDFLSGTSRVCSREHSVEWNGFTWLGAGRVGTVEAVGEGGELEARGIAMTLSGLTGGLLATALTPAEYKGRAVRMWCGQIGEEAVQSGTAQAGAASSLTLAAGTTGTDNEHNGKILRLLTGAGSVQEREISDYDGSTKVATVERAWSRNALTKSSAVDHANWTKQNGITITADYGAAPDGTVKADRVQTDGISLARYFQTVTGFAGQTVCFALKMRSLTGANQTISLHLRETGFGTNYKSEGKVVTPEWQTFTISVAIPGGSAGVMALVYDSSGALVWDFLSCEHQWNEGTTPDEFIETDAAAITLPDATTTYDLIHPRGIAADPIGPFLFKMDQLTYQLGQTATIRLTAESRLADWQRPRVRRYNNADHQVLYPNDKFFEHVEKQVEAVHLW